MGAWERYNTRMEVRGATRRDVAYKREVNYLNTKLPHSLSYKTVEIDNVRQDVAIINTDNLNIKFIYSLPGEDIVHGSLVFWEDNYWLVTERDAHDEIYTRAKIEQCNYELKWIDSESVIHSQWCIVEDGTKYLTGEYEDRNFVVTRGDSRLGLRIARNEHTAKFDRTYRFLIDDPLSDFKLSYLLTKPLKLGNVYNGKGIYAFVLQEVNSTEHDNHELSIADYYLHFPKENSQEEQGSSDNSPGDIPVEAGRKGWI